MTGWCCRHVCTANLSLKWDSFNCLRSRTTFNISVAVTCRLARYVDYSFALWEKNQFWRDFVMSTWWFWSKSRWESPKYPILFGKQKRHIFIVLEARHQAVFRKVCGHVFLYNISNFPDSCPWRIPLLNAPCACVLTDHSCNSLHVCHVCWSQMWPTVAFFPRYWGGHPAMSDMCQVACTLIIIYSLLFSFRNFYFNQNIIWAMLTYRVDMSSLLPSLSPEINGTVNDAIFAWTTVAANTHVVTGWQHLNDVMCACISV